LTHLRGLFATGLVDLPEWTFDRNSGAKNICRGKCTLVGA